VPVIARVAVLAAAGVAVAGAAFAAPAKAPRPPKVAKPVKGCGGPVPTPQPSSRTPSEALLDTLGVLRRPRAATDAVPASALERIFGGRPELDSARRVRDNAWLVPLEDVRWFPSVSAECLRNLPPKQRAATERAQREAARRPPVEGVTAVSTGEQGILLGRWSVDDIKAGRTFTVSNCAGPKHDQIRVSGLVPDGVGAVTITARDGTTTAVSVQDNVALQMFARPARASGLPAHLTLGSVTVALSARASLTQACNPPEVVGNGLRLDKPIHLKSGAIVELATRRWESEDTLPLLAAATKDHCLMIASRATLERRLSKQRFCVAPAQVRAQGVVARAVRLPDGALVLEGFVDRAKVAWVTVEHSPRGGARALWPARSSGAFFLAVRKGVAGRTFTFHAALRGKPVRYARLRTVSAG
jgi:hypothetical protein